MGCQCSKNDTVKEHIFKQETNTDQSIDSKNILNLNNNTNLIINNTIDSNLSKELNNRKIYTFQNTNQLIYQLFQHINKIRMNPMSIIEKVEMYKSNIFEKDGQILFDCGNKIYSILTKGKIAFDDCIRFLSTQKSIEPLELNNDLKIELTIDNELEKNIVSYEFIEKILKKKFEELKDKYIILGFHYDICSDNTEISSILQIVDDTKNKFSRRKNILNNKVKYVGISYVYIKENIICYYLLFGNKKK